MEVPTCHPARRQESRARLIITSGEGLGEAMCPPVQRESIGSSSSQPPSTRRRCDEPDFNVRHGTTSSAR